MLKQRGSTDPDHESDHRQSFEELPANTYLDETSAVPAPAGIVLVDDVLTEGKHFKVCQHLIRARYGNQVPIAGFLVARRIYQAEDFNSDEFLAE